MVGGVVSWWGGNLLGGWRNVKLLLGVGGVVSCCLGSWCDGKLLGSW